jgi:hypothetical protein
LLVRISRRAILGGLSAAAGPWQQPEDLSVEKFLVSARIAVETNTYRLKARGVTGVTWLRYQA